MRRLPTGRIELRSASLSGRSNGGIDLPLLTSQERLSIRVYAEPIGDNSDPSLASASLALSAPHDDRGDQHDRGARREHPAGGAGMGLDPLVERQIHRVRAFNKSPG